MREGRTADMASPEGYYTPVLVPERHAEAVEKYVKDLETLDELRAEQRAELRN